MRLLALATAGPIASVGLSLPDGSLDVVALGAGAERGRGVTPAVHRLLERHGLAARDLEGVVVEVGPGSFTGVRVGVATAKALALGLGVRIVGICSLDALAWACGPTEDAVLALRDARAGEAYFAIYRPRFAAAPPPPVGPPRPESPSSPAAPSGTAAPSGAAAPSGTAAPSGAMESARPAPLALGRLCKPTRGTAATIRTFVEERGLLRVLACGEDAERLAVTLPLAGLLCGVRTPTVGPADLLSLAVPRFHAGTTDDPDALAPLYLQPSTPERRLAEGRAP